MKLNIKFFSLLLVVVAFLATSCEIEPVENPNAPSIESFENGATLSELNLLANGVESIQRNDMAFYFNTVSIVGREYYNLDGADPRYTGELLGTSVLDPNGFLTTRAFAASYRVIRNAQILLNAIPNTEASLSTAQQNGYTGYAKTMIAYHRLLLLNRQFQNGIRLEVSDPENLGPFVSYDEAMGAVSSQLDEAANELAGAEFTFDISSGFDITEAGSPAEDFRMFNRALAARVALYQGNKSKALGFLNESFMDAAGDLNMGAYYVFGAGSGDILNPLFNLEGVNNIMAHTGWVDDAEDGDTRLAKVRELAAPVGIDGLTSPYQVEVYTSNTDPASIVRNEELILIMAEANIGTNNAAAVDAINVIRSAAGLADYSGDNSDSSLLDEVLNQRRYSLFGEGHRWVDLRRTGKLDKIELQRASASVHEQFPTPTTEGL